jgi:hypothetical protein
MIPGRILGSRGVLGSRVDPAYLRGPRCARSLVDLAQWIFEEFRITVAKQTLSRELGAMAIASCQPARAIMPRRRVWSRILKTYGPPRCK